MENAIYPAFVRKIGRGYAISFPDLPHCAISTGMTLRFTKDRARRALQAELQRLLLKGIAAPSPTQARSLVSFQGEQLLMVEAGGVATPEISARPSDPIAAPSSGDPHVDEARQRSANGAPVRLAGP